MTQRKNDPNTKTVLNDSFIRSEYSDKVLGLASEYKKTGNKKALNKLVLANKPLVMNIAKHYSKKFRIGMEDLVQEGYIGLMVGLKKFDPNRGTAFSTYVIQWIRSYVQKAAWNTLSVVNISIREQGVVPEVEPEEDTTYSQPQVSFAVNKSLRANTTPNSPNKQQRIRAILKRDITLNSRICFHKSDEAGVELGDLIKSSRSEAEQKIQSEQEARLVWLAISQLTEKEKRILIEMHMLDTPRTSAEISKELGVSSARVRYINRNARKKIKLFFNQMDKLN